MGLVVVGSGNAVARRSCCSSSKMNMNNIMKPTFLGTMMTSTPTIAASERVGKSSFFSTTTTMMMTNDDGDGDAKGSNGNDALVKTKIEEGSNVATLILNRPPVNSLSLEMCTSISSAIKELESNPNIQAVVLKSSNPSILSAGLDLTELLVVNSSSSSSSSKLDRLPKFWYSFQQLFLDLYGSRLAIIGAIEGHAPAAGCMIAMACDYRIMASSSSSSSSKSKSKSKSSTIGLNESQFGIAAPPWLGQLMIRTIGFRNAEKALTLGTLYTPEQALEIGLIDQIVDVDNDINGDDVDQKKNVTVLDASYDVAKKFARIPPQARMASKMLARKEYLDDLIKNRDADTEHFCNFIRNDMVQKGLVAYLEKLKRK